MFQAVSAGCAADGICRLIFHGNLFTQILGITGLVAFMVFDVFFLYAVFSKKIVWH